MKTTTRRIHHSDGSATDVIIRRTEIGNRVHEDVQQVHRTRQELEQEAKAGAIAGGIFLVGSLIATGLSILFSDDKK